MGRMKALVEQFKGYKIKGKVYYKNPLGKPVSMPMHSYFVKSGRLTHNTLKRAINTDGYAGLAIDEAIIHIYKCYGPLIGSYEQFDRTIILNKKQCLEGTK